MDEAILGGEEPNGEGVIFRKTCAMETDPDPSLTW